ncbi:S-layer homology domain-containing protein [Brevibacillus sp. SIMBA_040]
MADIAFASSNQSNVALGKQTTASSSLYIDNGDIHYSPEYAVDGNRSPFGETWTERWESEQVQSCYHVASNVCTIETNPPWIQVDLGGPHEINQWVVVGYMESNGFSLTVNRTQKVTIKGSLDGLHFDEIAHSNSGTIVEDESMIIHEGQFEEPVTYRFFRVEVNEMFDFVDEYYAAVAEFELYGKPVVIDNPDTTPPALANDEITPTNITQTAVTLTWEAATDNVTDTENLEYRVYQSTDSDIDTIKNMEDNGTSLGNGFTKDIESFSVTDLEPGTAYYFNVIVKDEAGNKRAYRMQKVNTESATPVMGGTAAISAISGAAKFGSTLTADVTGITYTPTTTQDVPSYQWKRDGDAILGAKNPTYTLVEEDIGKIITYTLTADGTHATGSVTSSGIGPVAKADGPGAPPAPVENSKTTTSISLIDSPGMEYSKDGGITWQDSPLFDGLTSVTDYSFVMRIKATATHEASATSPATAIRTAAQIPVTPVMGGTAAISGAAKFGSTLTANLTGITYTPTTTQDVPTYQWKRDGDAILGAKNPTYTLVEEDIGKIITYTLTADGTHATGSVTSSGIGPVAKADGPGAPPAPTEASKTANSITLTSTPGQEYSKDGGVTWQNSPIFEGLLPNTDYHFVTRSKETATTVASPSSPSVTIRTTGTPPQPGTPAMGGTAMITGEAKYGSTLMADLTGITYSPATTLDVPTLQWLRDGVAIAGATNSAYKLTQADIGTAISYTVSADGTHATGTVTSSGTSLVVKADSPTVPAAPSEASKTATSITLHGVTGQEYSKDGGISWQDSPLFEGLAPDTDYQFITRMKETATHHPSAPSAPITIRTSLSSQSYSVSYNGNGHTGGNAPVDKYEYKEGSRVTVLGNSGNLVKARYTFAGWNTKADGSGTTYTAGSTFMLGASNVILYAKWNAISGGGGSGGGGGGSSSGSSSSPATGSSDSAVNVWVNGKAENAGTVKTAVINGQTVLTILVDQKKLDEKLTAEGQHAVVTIPMYAKNDSVVVKWNGQMISSMTDKKTILEFKTERATYTLPAEQINLDAIVAQIAEQAALQDIKVLIEIAMPSAETLEMVETASQKGSYTYTFVVPPITFTVKAVYNEKIIDVSKFSAYVERSIVIPEGVDPNKITTGVIVEPEGKVRHVPTKVVVNDGTYFAKMNSLTNSTYAIIWNPVQFDDVTSHWSKQAVNDMGSRIVVDGTGKGVFHPDRQITRAEFTAIIVRGLGLKPEQGEMIYSDVKATDWYSTTINAANSYQLISGFGDGTFRPNEKITREQAMVILAKAMTLTGTKKSDQGVEKISRDYPDLTQAAAWAQKSIEECLQAGLVSGRANESLALKENITRAEVAVLLQRLLQAADLI